MPHVRGHRNWWEQRGGGGMPLPPIFDIPEWWGRSGAPFMGRVGQFFEPFAGGGATPFRPAPQQFRPPLQSFPQQLGPAAGLFPQQPLNWIPPDPQDVRRGLGMQMASRATALQGRPIALPQLQDQVGRFLQQMPFAPRRDYLDMSFDNLLQYAQELQDSLQQSRIGRQGFLQVAPTFRADTSPGGPLGSGGLGESFLQVQTQRQRFQARDVNEILDELDTLDPILAGSLRGRIQKEKAGVKWGRAQFTNPSFNVTPDAQMAAWASKLPQFEEAKRKVEEEWNFEFGPIYGEYLRYKSGATRTAPTRGGEIITSFPMGFREWMEKTPAVQAALRSKREFEQEETRRGEQRRRPPRFAAIQQRV